MEKTLKEQNSRMIWVFFSLNVLIFYGLAFTPIINFDEIELKSFVYGEGIWLLIVPLVLFIINGIISSGQKAIIVFWRYNDPLPACRAFSFYANKDPRIDLNILKSIYSPLPEMPSEQNSLWYKIYKKHVGDSVVNKSHKDFLLGRDMCAIAFLFFLFGGISGLFLIHGWNKWFYLAFTIIQYLVLSIVAQNHGKRFVCNVLSNETTVTK